MHWPSGKPIKRQRRRPGNEGSPAAGTTLEAYLEGGDPDELMQAADRPSTLPAPEHVAMTTERIEIETDTYAARCDYCLALLCTDHALIWAVRRFMLAHSNFDIEVSRTQAQRFP